MRKSVFSSDPGKWTEKHTIKYLFKYVGPRSKDLVAASDMENLQSALYHE